MLKQVLAILAISTAALVAATTQEKADVKVADAKVATDAKAKEENKDAAPAVTSGAEATTNEATPAKTAEEKK